MRLPLALTLCALPFLSTAQGGPSISEVQPSKVTLLDSIILLIQNAQYTLISILALWGAFWIYRQIRREHQLVQASQENKKVIEKQAKQLKELADKLEEQEKEIEELDAIKSRLFANISQELRAPLSLISSPIKKLLTGHQLNASTRDELLRGLQNIDKLLSVSKQISDLVRNPSEGHQLHLSRFNLVAFLKHLNSSFQHLCQSKKIDIQVDQSIDRSLEIVTDAEKLETILNHLLSNALKYTSADGQVHIQSRTLEGQLLIEVIDHGEGISKQDLPYIFDRYYQAKDQKLVQSGFGIGLSICKKYAELLGGTLGVQSMLGLGSTFTLQLPLPSSETINAMPRLSFKSYPAEPPLIPSLAIQKIKTDSLLIAVENPELAEYMLKTLQTEYEVELVYNGQEALKHLQQQIPALVITDLKMPVMDGMELIKHMKANEHYSSIPVLMLTMRDSILDELKAFRLGIDDYLLKPFDEMQLRTIIYNLTNTNNGTQENLAIDFLLESKIITSTGAVDFDSKNKAWLEALEDVVAESIDDYRLDVNILAAKMQLSPSSLFKKMKDLTGLTPKKYIMELRLLKARKLLETGESSTVKTIAYKVGFTSEKVFSRNFKARFGKYPSEYMSPPKS